MSFNNPFKKFTQKPSEKDQKKRDNIAAGVMAAGALGAAASGAYIHQENNRLDLVKTGNATERITPGGVEGKIVMKSSSEAPGVYTIPAPQRQQIDLNSAQNSMPAPSVERSSVDLKTEKSAIDLSSERFSITEPLAPEKVSIDLESPRFSIETPEK